MHELGVRQIKSSAYHPESQVALERFHASLKTMIRAYVEQHEKDWDVGLPLLMFAARESVQESLGFSPFDLVFGHHVRGPLKLLKEQWLNNDDSVKVNLLDYVSKFRSRLHEAGEIAKKNLEKSQQKMKMYYDRNVKAREYKPGDKVLVLLSLRGNPLQVKYHGPYKVLKKVNGLDYVVETPDRRKPSQSCHINVIRHLQERMYLLMTLSPAKTHREWRMSATWRHLSTWSRLSSPTQR